MRLALVIVPLLLAPTQAGAGETAWQDFSPEARIRLISGDIRASDGTTTIALEVEMSPGTKTYWRVPGETGIPLELDFSASDGVGAHEVLWPLPTVEVVNGYTDYVYDGPVIIPIRLQVSGDRPVVRADVLMGICSDICVPAASNFTLTLDLARADPGHDLRIVQAIAEVPIPWTAEPAPVGEPVFDGESLWVRADGALADEQTFIADASTSGHLFGAPKKSPETGLLGFPLLGGESAGNGVVGQWVRFLFATPDGPYEVARRIGSTAP